MVTVVVLVVEVAVIIMVTVVVLVVEVAVIIMATISSISSRSSSNNNGNY